MLGTDIWGPPNEFAAHDFHQFSIDYDQAYFEGLADPISIEGGSVANRIIEKRDAQEPASFIRVSDGEGNLVPLSYDIPVGNRLLAYCLRRISYIHFGSEDVIVDNLPFFSTLIRDAVNDADLVGFPRIGTIKRGFETEDRKKDVRALIGNRCAYILRSRFSEVSDAWFSRGLLPHYGEILQNVDRIGLITVYPELVEKLQRAFNVGSVRFIKVPTQAAFLSATDRRDSGHYPGEMKRILDEIIVERRGMIFLVAAGLLGKRYASEVKKRGGIAIDIGSIAEVWMGIQARGLAPDFIEKWSL